MNLNELGAVTGLPTTEGAIIGFILGCALVYAIFFFLAREQRRKALEHEHEIHALKGSIENTRNETILQAKEEALRIREHAEEQMQARRDALDKLEEKLYARDNQVEAWRERLDDRERQLNEASKAITASQATLHEKITALEESLLRVANWSKEEARESYLAQVEDEFRSNAAELASRLERDAVEKAAQTAKKTVLDIMERSTVEYVTEATIAVANLPTEDMKGRIIGREGRNIRAFEQVTGVDLIIDDTPEAVLISCFDPVRRETARLALMNLMVDGRIHPGRIEELYEKAQLEVQRTIEEAGVRAVRESLVGPLPPKIVEMMGRLRFRTSYAQNVLDHSVETAHLSAMLAAELKFNEHDARLAGFLHDIGKGLGSEHEGPHALTGMEFLRDQGIGEPILNAVGAHHADVEPATPISKIVIIADSISAARPGARRENLDNYIKRLESLELLANSFDGVERSYAMQAGRELRLIVKPAEIDDLGAARLAHEVARKIESQMDFPGQIKVTVIRETRASEVAK